MFEGPRHGRLKHGRISLLEIQFYRCISVAMARNRWKKILFSRTISRVRVHKAVLVSCRAKNFLLFFFALSSFFLSPYLPFIPRLLLLSVYTSFLPLSARREIRDMHCFLQEKQWSCFCANHDVDRRESTPQLVYGGSHLKAKQMFSQSQPL